MLSLCYAHTIRQEFNAMTSIVLILQSFLRGRLTKQYAIKLIFNYIYHLLRIQRSIFQ